MLAEFLQAVSSYAPTVTDTQAPVVAITSPAAGTAVAGTVTITGTASDNIGTTKVEVYRGQTLLGTATKASGTVTNSTWTFSWDSSNLNQLVNLNAKAYDSANNVGLSETVQVTASNMSSPPKSGDVNGDGVVNGIDLSSVLSNYGLSGASRLQGDVNADGTVNGLDLSAVLNAYGS